MNKSYCILSIVVILFISGCTSVPSKNSDTSKLGTLDECTQKEYFNFTFSASPGFVGSYRMYFAVDNKINNDVYGMYNRSFYNVSRDIYGDTITGVKAEFLILDHKNYNSLIDGSEHTKYYSDGEESGYFAFVPDHTDHYLFAIDNSDSKARVEVLVIGVWDYCKKT